VDIAEAVTPPASRREQVATRIVFFAIGFASGAWAPLTAFAKARLGAGDGELGLLLLCLGFGSIAAMPIAGAVAARLGFRTVLTAASAAALLVFPLLASLDNAPALAAALFVFGASIGSVDCVINMQAIVVEKDSGRSMMSGFHALYSLGGMLGAGGMSGLLAFGLTPLSAALCVAGALLVAMLAAWRGLKSERGEAHGPAFAVPHGIVLLIGVCCFIVFLTEGSALDWSAVFLRTVRGAAPGEAGLGYVAFSATMMIGRLVGDRFVGRLGAVRTVAIGALVAAAGLAFATLAPGWIAAVAGYGLVGAGCANIVPVLFTAAGRQSAMPHSQAVPAVSVLGYAGILAGPAAIGFVAAATSLPIALFGVAVLLLGVAAMARRLESRRIA
jgi:predicted MFS family arabinose efflux permease